MKTRIMAIAAVVAGLAMTDIAHADDMGNHDHLSAGPRTYAAGYCGFGILAEPERSHNFILERTVLADGTRIDETRGQLIRILTNMVTGKSIRVNISGPGRGTYYPDRSYLIEGSGPWIMFIPRRFNYNAPVVTITSGKFTYAYNPNNDSLQWSSRGALRDVCAELS